MNTVLSGIELPEKEDSGFTRENVGLLYLCQEAGLSAMRRVKNHQASMRKAEAFQPFLQMTGHYATVLRLNTDPDLALATHWAWKGFEEQGLVVHGRLHWPEQDSPQSYEFELELQALKCASGICWDILMTRGSYHDDSFQSEAYHTAWDAVASACRYLQRLPAGQAPTFQSA